MKTLPALVAAVVYVLALALWAGGLVVLGAIVAPTVFGVVPAPTSADAMTLVFRRFDVLAIASALVALVAEAVFTLRAGKVGRKDIARGAALVVAAGLAIFEGTYLSPSIARLHAGGAVRGLGEAGAALERLHKMAESLAKLELVLLVVVVVLLVARLPHGLTPERRSDPV